MSGVATGSNGRLAGRPDVGAAEGGRGKRNAFTRKPVVN